MQCQINLTVQDEENNLEDGRLQCCKCAAKMLIKCSGLKSAGSTISSARRALAAKKQLHLPASRATSGKNSSLDQLDKLNYSSLSMRTEQTASLLEGSPSASQMFSRSLSVVGVDCKDDHVTIDSFENKEHHSLIRKKI